MCRAAYARMGDPGAEATADDEDRAPARVAVAGSDRRAGSRVLTLRKRGCPALRLVCRRKARDSYFKGGNLNNAVYNIFEPDASFMVRWLGPLVYRDGVTPP